MMGAKAASSCGAGAGGKAHVRRSLLEPGGGPKWMPGLDFIVQSTLVREFECGILFALHQTALQDPIRGVHQSWAEGRSL